MPSSFGICPSIFGSLRGSSAPEKDIRRPVLLRSVYLRQSQMRSSGRGGQRTRRPFKTRSIRDKSETHTDDNDEPVRQTTSTQVKAGHSTSGSSSSSSPANVPDPGVGTSTRTQTESSSVESDLYEMHIIIQPPIESRPGNTLTPPLIISLRRKEGSRTEERLIADIHSYWAFVSAVSEDGLVALAPPSNSLLSGTLADSVHEARLTEAEEDVGHVAFQNLAINQAGRFRLRISLLQMPGSQDGPSRGGWGQASVRNIASVLSHVIHVENSASAPRIGQLIL